ncbi:MAG TPA: YceI family protein [Candidatus Acidoferrales bacterium]|nr:YceI family protein [Candidatus Acidoferrales bacterium]
MRRRAAVLSIAAFLCAAASAEQRQVDAAKSEITVRVYKAGVFGAFGHDHEIAAPVKSGAVDTSAHTVELRVAAASLKVRDPGASEKDRGEIQNTMIGPEVLDAGHFPEIVFTSSGAEAAGDGAWRVRGNVVIHGQSRPIEVDVRESGGHYRGSALLKQSQFGIKPVKVAGGAIRVKDEIRIEFDIQLAQ